MMLDDPYAVKSEPVGELDLVDRLGVRGSFAAADVRRDGELVEKVDQQTRSSMCAARITAVYCQ
jgi:hypothetical protein